MLRSAADVASLCSQLRSAGVWGFALDFADAPTAAVATNPALLLPPAPGPGPTTVALDRSLPNNSIGMPLHYDMDEPPAPPPGAGASAGVVGRLEGVAFSGHDGCAAYVPLVAATAAGGGELAAAAAEVAAVLRDAACTKVTVDLKQQLRQVRGPCGAQGIACMDWYCK